jgi:hypothetical protein
LVRLLGLLFKSSSVLVVAEACTLIPEMDLAFQTMILEGSPEVFPGFQSAASS